MVEEGITLDEVLEAIRNSEILEDYPGHRRGPCCLILGWTKTLRPLHVVCTTGQPVLIIITVYEPRPPKWVTPREGAGGMRCSIERCPGEYEERKIVHTLCYRGKVVVFEGVPAEVCPVCGDVLLKPETVRRIEQLLEGKAALVSMAPLYQYA